MARFNGEADEVVATIRAGGELVTVLLGAQASEGLGERVADYITTRHPGVEVMVYRGGQSRDLLQFGVE